jgi:DNA-binding transcriptional MerR regulator
MPRASKAPGYFQEWYEDNCDELNKRRRERYAEDPEYRKRVQRWNRDARARRRKEAEKEERKAKQAVKIQTSGAWKTVEVEVDGVKVRMFTIGALAKATGKGISTIRVWERNGVLPETPYRSKKGDRLYTLEMVESIQAALRKAGKLNIAVLKEKKQPAHVERKVYFKGKGPVRMRLYKVGTLAKAVNRTVVALTQMEKRGVLPKTPLVSSSLKYRLYTLDMIEVVQAAFDRRGGVVRGKSEWEDFYDEIVDGWTRLGIMDARLDR